MERQPERPAVRLGLPKGRIQSGVFALLADAGIRVVQGSREYRPTISLQGISAKIQKPQSVVQMLQAGSRDLGFAGADWVRELDADRLVELLDTGLDPVRVVAAAPDTLLEGGALPRRPLVVASEYRRITTQWMEQRGIDGSFVRSFGATEVFPPEDADCIVDNTATGSTLAANGLSIVDELMRSSTRLYANREALEDPERARTIEDLVMVLRSVIEARQRVMIEVNVAADKLERLVDALPCMREPTVANLHGGAAYAVKAAIPRPELPVLIPRLKELGGTDVVVTQLSQIVP